MFKELITVWKAERAQAGLRQLEDAAHVVLAELDWKQLHHANQKLPPKKRFDQTKRFLLVATHSYGAIQEHDTAKRCWAEVDRMESIGWERWNEEDGYFEVSPPHSN